MNKNGISTTQLAKICGVSQGTVDRALNNRKGINKETKEKVLAVAKEYGYRHAPDCNESTNEQLKIIGIVLPDLKNDSFVDLVCKIQDAALNKGLSTVIMFSSQSKEEEIKCILRLYRIGVAGILLSPVNCDDDFIKFLCSLDLPILTVNKKIDSLPSFKCTAEQSESLIESALAYIVDGVPFLLNSVEA